jgi:molecular chaperone DnaJ
MDHYNRLGVAKNASQDDIKRAYRKLAMQHHPDRGGDEKLFQEINQAYDTLKDPAKRQQYDRPKVDPRVNVNTGNMDDVFKSFFGQGFAQARQMRRNGNVSLNVRMTLEEVATGKDIIGRYVLNSGREEIANIRIPPGVESGTVMRYQGLGDDSIKQAPRGDLTVQINVLKHKTFERDRLHLRTKCSINVLELILGTEVVVEKLTGGPLNVKIPAGTHPGTILSIPGYGLPDPNTGRTGNLYLEIKGRTPKIDRYEVLEKVKNINDEVSKST